MSAVHMMATDISAMPQRDWAKELRATIVLVHYPVARWLRTVSTMAKRLRTVSGETDGVGAPFRDPGVPKH